MKVKMWGVRGSVPTPLLGDQVEHKIRLALKLAEPGDIVSDKAIDLFVEKLPNFVKNTYGGNTTCVELVTNSGDILVFDCGSGLVNLGKTLMQGEFSKGLGTVNLFISHTHWDHIHGVPFFSPIYVKGNTLNFYSLYDDLKKRFEYQQTPLFFPIELDAMQANKNFFEIRDDETFYLNDVSVYAKKMPHPGGSCAYRIEHDGKSFVFTGDCEFRLDAFKELDQYEKLFQNADVVVFDAQYVFDDFMNRLDWGHSSASVALDIAGKFNIKQLILFHHDPSYSDEKLDSILSSAIMYKNANNDKIKNVEIEMAYEGMVVEF